MAFFRITPRQQRLLEFIDREARAVYERSRKGGCGHAVAYRVAQDDMAVRYQAERLAFLRDVRTARAA